MQSMNQQCAVAMSQEDTERLDSIAGLLLLNARENGSRTYEGIAHFFLSYYTPDADSSLLDSKMQHIEAAESIATLAGDRWLLCRIYNQRGVWELAHFGHISTAQYWFMRSIEHSPDRDNRSHAMPAEINLSETYRLTGDTIGLSHDRSIFEYISRQSSDTLPRYVAALNCATYLASEVGDTAELKPYIEEMRLHKGLSADAVEAIYARHFLAKGNLAEAEKHIIRTDTKTHPECALLYAEILSAQSRYAESDAVLDSIHMVAAYHKFKLFGEYQLMRSRNAEGMGQLRDALAWQKRYEQFRDSLDNVHALDLSKRYRTQYEVYVKDNEILRQKSEIRNYILVISLIVISVSVSGAFLLLWLRKRNRLYKDIVSQNRERILREQALARELSERDARIAELESGISSSRHDEDDKGTEAIGNGRLSEEKANSIFKLIRHYTDAEQIWRDMNITRDRFAELVGCNRTYFTEVIKTKTGMNYSRFMNSCRVQEVVKVLSFPESEISIAELSKQLGFLSLQTFYAAFKSVVGMSPTAYRKTALKL